MEYNPNPYRDTTPPCASGRSHAPARRYVYFGYFVSIGLVLIAIVVGTAVDSIHKITTWITFALYGGYVAPNVLKWHWWRFNGQGYFAGMISGVVMAIVVQLPATINGFFGTELWEFPGLYSFFVTAPVSLNILGISGSETSMIHPIILAVRAAFWLTMSPSVPSPPWGHDRLYSMAIAPADSSFRVFPCQLRLSLQIQTQIGASASVVGPPGQLDDSAALVPATVPGLCVAQVLPPFVGVPAGILRKGLKTVTFMRDLSDKMRRSKGCSRNFVCSGL